MDVEEREENSLMDDLAAAWDAAENTGTDDTGSEEADAGYEEPEPAAAETDVEEEPEREPVTAKEGKKSEKKTPPAEGDEVNDLDAPPAGLPPAAREVWADVPEPVKAAIAKREQDYSKGVQMYAAGAKRAQEMDTALQPFQQFFAINGGNPSTVVKDVLGTAATLQMGSPNQKAQAAANLIKQFGVDIGMLDSVLVGQAPGEGNQQTGQFEQMLDQRLQPLQQQLQTYQQREQQAVQREQQATQAEIQQFAESPQNEFYKDVRMEMADIMDLAANRGYTMGLQEAYDKACQLHPEISKIIAGRNSQQQVRRSRRAGSSVTGAPAGGSNNQPEDMRQAIEMAWENAGRM